MKILNFPVERMETFSQKAKGLMFRTEFNTALLFDLKFESILNSAIHALFVFVPFDVIFLNKKKQIVDMKTVKPWTLLVAPKKPAQYIIEVPEGTIKKQKLKINQRIQTN